MPDPTLRDLLDERHKAHTEEHRIHELAHAREHAATEQAIATATATLDKRLDAMNEFRDQLRDQAATFIRREQLEVFIAQYERAHDEVVTQIRTEREERRAAEASHALTHRGDEGQKKGISQSTAVIVGAIGLAATIITVVIVIANFVTATP